MDIVTGPDIRKILKKALIQIGLTRSPDFLIIGAQKAGTTLLYSYLSQHPQILRPAFKEAHFFDYDFNYRKGVSHYLMNFQLLNFENRKQLRFEATPDYLYYERCANRIKKNFPLIKLIVSLRDPIARAYSAWNMHHNKFKEHQRHYWLYDPRSFEDAILQELKSPHNQKDIFAYVSKGAYSVQLRYYLKLFALKDILVLDNDELKTNDIEVLNGITEFLGIEKLDKDGVNKNDMFWDNKNDYKVEMSSEIHDRLKSFFTIYDSELRHMTGRSFSWMN